MAANYDYAHVAHAEEEILPYMRAQQAEVTRQRAEIDRKGGEVDRQGAEIVRQGAEIDRLRAENRALLNSILGIAGVPPIVVTTPPEPLSGGARIPMAGSYDGESGSPSAPLRVNASPHSTSSSAAINAHVECGGLPPLSAASETGPATPAQPAHARHAHLAVPTRRRSWQQIHRAFEFAALQKKKPSEDPLT